MFVVAAIGGHVVELFFVALSWLCASLRSVAVYGLIVRLVLALLSPWVIRVDGFLLSGVLISTVVALSCCRLLGSRICGATGAGPVIRLARFRPGYQLEFAFFVYSGGLNSVTPSPSVFFSRKCYTSILLLHFYARIPTEWRFSFLFVARSTA